MTNGSTAAPTRWAPTYAGLSYEATVPRHFVHRAAVAEVLLTDWQEISDDTFVCAAQWPRGHGLQSTRNGDFDPLLVAETIRQTGILLAHVGYDVPLGAAFLMRRLRFTCAPAQMRHDGGRPLDLVIEVSVVDIARRSGTVSSMRIDTVLRAGGIQIAEGSGWLRCVDPHVYDRLRRRAVPDGPGLPLAVAPVPPAVVGRDRTDDVVIGLGDREGTYRLRVPLNHPVYFDHALDHVPGMLAIEALRQSAVAAVGLPTATLVAADAHFDGFMELDHDCVLAPRIQAEQDGRWSLLVDIDQGRRTAIHGSVSLVS